MPFVLFSDNFSRSPKVLEHIALSSNIFESFKLQCFVVSLDKSRSMAETANELVTEQDELQPYYEDVIQLFTEAKDDKPFNFIATYFENVAAQQHVLFRRFEYISLTIHNRNSFIFQFSSIFESFYTHKVMVTGDENINYYVYYVLISLALLFIWHWLLLM
eukprot:1154074_1